MGTAKKELPLARSMCWHCQSDIGGEYFCNQCVKVQPLSRELLRGARKTLEAKRAALENRLAELFQIWDKLVEKHAHDQAQAAAKERTLKEMRDLLSQRTYVTNMLQNITEALA